MFLVSVLLVLNMMKEQVSLFELVVVIRLGWFPLNEAVLKEGLATAEAHVRVD